MKKKLLFITQVYPSALTGTTVKTRHTIEYLLEEGFEVDVCCVHYSKMVKNQFVAKGLKIYVAKKDSILSKFSFLYLLRIFNLLFDIIPVRVKKMYDKRLDRLIVLLYKKNNYDYVFYDGFSTLQYLKLESKKNIYIDDEDITDLLWKRIKRSNNIILKIFFFTEFVKCLIYEKKYLNKVSQIWAIAPNTYNRLKTLSMAKIFLMPTIVPERKSSFNTSSTDLVFTGLLSWMENTSGLKWFLDNFWNELRKEFPNLKLHVVGQMAQPEFVNYLSNFKGVKLHGFVPNLEDIYKKSALAIAPILINSGIKVKILTYLSFGLPVVSLHQATWGLSTNKGIVVTNEEQFGKGISQLLNDSALRKKLSVEARENTNKFHSKNTLRRFFKKTKIFKNV